MASRRLLTKQDSDISSPRPMYSPVATSVQALRQSSINGKEQSPAQRALDPVALSKEYFANADHHTHSRFDSRVRFSPLTQIQDASNFNQKELLCILQLAALQNKQLHLAAEAIRERRNLYWPNTVQDNSATTTPFSPSPLAIAAYRGDEIHVKTLLLDTDPNLLDWTGSTPLHWAALGSKRRPESRGTLTPSWIACRWRHELRHTFITSKKRSQCDTRHPSWVSTCSSS